MSLDVLSSMNLTLLPQYINLIKKTKIETMPQENISGGGGGNKPNQKNNNNNKKIQPQS